MVLAELVGVIEAVRKRAKEFQTELQKSEALTRYALIDPILRALGWDTADPAQVRPEFPTESGNPDYALFWEGKPHIMVEAKALGKSLDAAKDKGFQYCWRIKVSYYAVADGNAWEVHDLREMGGKVILRVVLSEGSSGEAARELLALWRPAMPSVEKLPVPVMERGRPRDDNPPPPPLGDRISLAQLLADMTSRKIPKRSPAPRTLVLPDGKEYTLARWRDLLLSVVDWCQPRLSGRIPITSERGSKALVATSAAGMRAPRAVGPYQVEMAHSARGSVKAACRILSLVGESPESVYVVPK